MSYRIDESIISNFLTHHTRPLRLSTLSTDSRICPICHNPYSPHDSSLSVHPLILADTPEYPVQVKNRGSCMHVFGRRCIEAHIRARQPWSHTCPMCRTEWFPPPSAGRSEAVEALEAALNGLARIDSGDEGVRREVEALEIALGRISDILYGQRWI